MNPINSALSFCKRQLNLIDTADTRIKLDDAVGMKRSRKVISDKTIGKLQLIFNRELGLNPSATSIQETKAQVRRACTIVHNMKEGDARAALLPLIETFRRGVDAAQEKWDLQRRISNAIQSHTAAAAEEDVSDDDSELWPLGDETSDGYESDPPPSYSHAIPAERRTFQQQLTDALSRRSLAARSVDQ